MMDMKFDDVDQFTEAVASALETDECRAVLGKLIGELLISGELVPVPVHPLDVVVAETAGVPLPQCYRIVPTGQ